MDVTSGAARPADRDEISREASTELEADRRVSERAEAIRAEPCDDHTPGAARRRRAGGGDPRGADRRPIG